MQLNHLHEVSKWPAYSMVCPYCNTWRPFTKLLEGNDDVICESCADVLELEREY